MRYTFLFLTAAMVHAATLVNGNFESGIAPGTTKPAGSTDVTGWAVLSDSVDWVDGIGSVPEINGTNGSLFIDLNGNLPGGIQQTFGTLVGQAYLITFDMNANTVVGASKSLQISAGADSQTFTFVPNAATDVVWQPKSFVFTATGPTTTLTFVSLVNASNAGPLIDNVAIADIREPASAALVALGCAAVWLRRHASKAAR